jgi:hypothetical protein
MIREYGISAPRFEEMCARFSSSADPTASSVKNTKLSALTRVLIE